MTFPTNDELNDIDPVVEQKPAKVQTELAVNKKFEVTKKDGTRRIYRILDHDILELNSQALINNTAYVCVYFPTGVDDEKTVGKDHITTTDWQNQGYFITNTFEGVQQLRKQIKPIDDDWFVKHFKINVRPAWLPRWEYNDMVEWKKTTEPTNPRELLYLLIAAAKKYIWFDEESTYTVFCLWIIGTYFYRLFPAYPYLDFTGTKRAGKTKTLELIRLTAFNTIMSPDLTGSTVFRLIQETGATMLIDEAENFKNQKSETAQHVRTLLVQGFKKDQYAYRTNTDQKMVVESFNLYSPKALGHINAFDDVLEDRCIQIIMKRSISKDIQNTHPNPADPSFQQIRNLSYRIFLDFANDIETWKQKAQESMPVSGRERELWLPIMTLARFFESFGMTGIVDAVVSYANSSHKERQATDEEENQDYRVINFIESQISEYEDWITTTKLFEEFAKVFSEYGINEKYFSIRILSQTLKRLGFKKAHKDKGTSWHITKETVNLVKERMGMDIEKDPSGLSGLSEQAEILPKTKPDTSQPDVIDLSAPEFMPKSDTSDTSDTSDSSLGVAKTNTNMNETDRLTHADTSVKIDNNRSVSSVSQQIEKDREYLCECGYGPVWGYEESKSSGNLIKLHQNLGHKVIPLDKRDVGLSPFDQRESIDDNDDWETPKSVFDELCKKYNIIPILDVSASEKNHKTDEYFTKQENALLQEWKKDVWCNPPHSKTEEFVRKAYNEWQKHNINVLMIIPANSTVTRYAEECIWEPKKQGVNIIVEPLLPTPKFLKNGREIDSARNRYNVVIWQKSNISLVSS